MSLCKINLLSVLAAALVWGAVVPGRVLAQEEGEASEATLDPAGESDEVTPEVPSEGNLNSLPAAEATAAPTVSDVSPLDDWHIPEGLFDREAAERKRQLEAQGQAARDLPEGEPVGKGRSEQVTKDAEGQESKEPGADPGHGALEEANLSEELFLKRMIPNKERRRRLDRAKSLRKAIVRSQRAAYRGALDVDPRGEPELTVCSANLNNYGLDKDYKRIMRKSKLGVLRRKERSLTKAVDKVGCDVIALQGVIGREFAAVRQAMERLISCLEKAGEGKWLLFIGESNSRISRNAFLVRQGKVEVGPTRSYYDRTLPVFSDSNAVKFPRGPFEIELSVPGKAGARSRKVVLLTMVFQDKVTIAEESESLRVQMAEELRRTVERRSAPLEAEENPVVIMLGDRRVPLSAASAQVLSGTLRIEDFRHGGRCRLEENGRPNCEEKVPQPRVLFGLLGEQLGPPLRVKKRLIEGETKYSLIRPSRAGRKAARKRTSEIYMLEQDLWLAREKPGGVPRYSAGYEQIENGCPESPLVWVRLNW